MLALGLVLGFRVRVYGLAAASALGLELIVLVLGSGVVIRFRFWG